MSQNFTLNDTLEEQLRLECIAMNKKIRGLNYQIDLLQMAVKDEQDAKYRAYIRISELQQEITKLKAKIKNT